MPATNPILSVITPTDVIAINSIDVTISKILRQLGIRPKFNGFNYLKTAIKLCYENPDDNVYITKCLYPNVSAIHGVETARIERDIRYAISSMACTDLVKDQIFGYVASKYTNKEFISAIIEYMICLD